MRPVIVLFVDECRLRKWQEQALLQIADSYSFVVLNCTNTRFTRRPFRHAFYYLLNIASLKTAHNRAVPLPSGLDIKDLIDFDSEWDGAWQRLPTHVLERLAAWRPVLGIKFGMGLLRVPDERPFPILSYHHGDPRRFRGRPAGFYELLGDAPAVGQIVQNISNKLDAGEVVAFGETRVRPHSYRGTMLDSYRLSPLLMKIAVRNCLAGKVLPIEPNGKNHRLPSNFTVLRFASKVIAAKARRLGYGVFFEKAWKVAQAHLSAQTAEQLLAGLPPRRAWRVCACPRQYHFLADPFPHPDGGMLVEALRRSDGQGEIVHIDGAGPRVLCTGSGHFSYPATIDTREGCFLMPEVAEWSPPRLYRLNGKEPEFARHLAVEGSRSLVDPTLFESADRVYLFANDVREGPDVLRLWSADSLAAQFTEHPDSPIRISPEGARMAGSILQLGGRLYRVGQNSTRDYGDGIFLFEIEQLSASAYEEARLGKIAFRGVQGPHTLNLSNGVAMFDFYNHRFTPLAGFRRIRGSLWKRRVAAENGRAIAHPPA